MKAHQMRFDTHQYVKKARAVGFSEPQAEFQAKEIFHLLWESIDGRLDQLVTKEEFKKDLQHLEIKLETKIMAVETKITAVDSKLTWLISLIGFISVTIAIVTLLNKFHII